MIWESHIKNLFKSQINKPCMYLVCLIISELYEYCIWYIHQYSEYKNIKLNDLKRFCDDKGIDKANLKSWYDLRNTTLHAPFNLKDRYVVTVINSDVFKELLYVCLKDLRIYDDIICNYSLWLNVGL